MTKAKQTIQDALYEVDCHRLDHEYEISFKNLELVDAALNLLADLEAGKVRVVPTKATLGLMPLHMYEAIIKEAPDHEAETYLKGLK